jgi:hypothetical protein
VTAQKYPVTVESSYQRGSAQTINKSGFRLFGIM